MKPFEPDYTNVERAARNIEAPRLPLYEHSISDSHFERVLGREYAGLAETGDAADMLEYMRCHCEAARRLGYDTVSIEGCIGPAMPGSGALGGHIKGAIGSRADFDRYPWDEVPEIYFRMYRTRFEALREALPPGMKAVGGVGNGVFESVEDIVGFSDLCYIKADDPDLFADLFRTVGRVSLAIWERFLREFGDIYCVPRFGDDLGFKSSTLLAREDIVRHVVPQYRAIIALVHSYGKPLLYHSCGNIFDVMEEIVDAGIDAKHSNEDIIAPFPVWVERYGDRIGNFGGIDTDAVCQLDRASMKEYILEVISKCSGRGGFAFGSGNSIPAYVPFEGYMNMIEIVREYRNS